MTPGQRLSLLVDTAAPTRRHRPEGRPVVRFASASALPAALSIRYTERLAEVGRSPRSLTVAGYDTDVRHAMSAEDGAVSV